MTRRARCLCRFPNFMIAREAAGEAYGERDRGRPPARRLLMVGEDLVERAGELKRQLVEFSQHPRYDRAFREMLAEHGEDADTENEQDLILLWDFFVLEHRLPDGRTVAEQFVDTRPDLPPQDRQM